MEPYTRRAQYYETDQMGIIHHGNYIRWFEEGRVDFMEKIGFGYEKSIQSGVDIAVLEVKCQYRSMVRFGDVVHIHVFITRLTPAKMVVGYKIEDAATGELRTTGKTTHCFLDSKTHGILRLNRAIPDLYELFGKYVVQEG